jgi:putative membrane-bound dehydrogenase-like protein
MTPSTGSSRRQEAPSLRLFKVSLLTSAATFCLAAHAALPPPRSPADSLKAIHTKPNLIVELVASEPAVMDPVAIDWDARGRLWVVEQPDYPQGMDGNWKPGGRVKILTDADADGRYEKSTLFLGDIPWPTGITCWRNGVLIGAAPDILYAEDTDGDGKADVVKKLFTGFITDNYNARINSLALGLDNWLHGASGGRGGKIRSELTGTVTDISGRDVRLWPDTGAFEVASGATQHGRARNDWDDWFGCSNSRWIFHFPLPDHYLRRNPHVAAPGSSVTLAESSDSALNPKSQLLDRWNNPDSLGHVTAAGGLGIYRDVLLGAEYYGNAFIGEAAHNLVRRFRLDPDDSTFTARRPANESTTEFFASEDNWTRPVQVRTGPDGALYVVDMYRAVIEHTRWIPADKLAGLDVRAGDSMGRIYRVRPRDAKLRPVADLTKLDAKQLATALDTPNGTTRDLVHLQLLHRGDTTKPDAEPLVKLASAGQLPAVRVQALAALDGIKSLPTTTLLEALSDEDAQVRRHAVRLCFERQSELGSATAPGAPNRRPADSSPSRKSENEFSARAPKTAGGAPALPEACLKLTRDPTLLVRYQLALSLGEWDDPRAATALAEIARSDFDSSWLRAAVLSSSARRPMEILRAILAHDGSGAGRSTLLSQLIATDAAQAQKPAAFVPLLEIVAGKSGTIPQLWQLGGLAQLLDALDRKKLKLAAIPGGDRATALFDAARVAVADSKSTDTTMETALRLFGRGTGNADADAAVLVGLLGPGRTDRVQKAALTALTRARSPKTSDLLLADWAKRGPAERQSIINILASREEWTMKLLDAVEQGTVSVGEVPVANRQSLARHANAAVRERAAKLFAVGSGDRAAVVAQYQSVGSLKGDGARGATVFANNCASCHAYLGRGFEIGPNLSAYRTKETGDFLAAILDPNAAMDARFTVYNIETKDGRSLSGVIASESANSLVLAMAGGVKENLLRSDIAELRASPLSLMPEGLEAVLQPQDIADLIAFVKGSD